MTSTLPERPLRIAFADIANPGWTAGANYYYNTFSALRQLPAERRPRIQLITWPWGLKSSYDIYRGLADDQLEGPVEPPPPQPAARPPAPWLKRQLRRLRRPAAPPPAPAPPPHAFPRLAALLAEQQADAIFTCWLEFGPRFPVPLLGWIPDFQHVHLPELFQPEELQRRDRLFQAMAASSRRIIVSSEDVRRDFERFSPAAANKARVLRFVVQLPEDALAIAPGWISAHYSLPERFIYLPDQFWRHKNHEVVVEALALVKRRRPDLAVVCTGNPSDNRAASHFGELLAKVSRLGLRDQFIVLGWVPHAHIFHLMRQSVAVLQPSLFEGWSTTVEETKSLGKTIVISDIAVHREQDPPQALFFSPQDAHALAECLLQAYDTCQPGPDLALEAQAASSHVARTQAFADTLLEIVRDARVAG